MTTEQMTTKQRAIMSQTKRRLTTLTAIIATSLATSCGGGGGGTSQFAGVWNGGVSLVEDECHLVSDSQTFLSFVHLINQDGDSIVLDNGALTFSGTVTGDKSFSVDVSRASTLLSGHGSCSETITWRYEQIKRNNAPFVVRSSEISCTDGTKCAFSYSGSGYRNDNGGGPIAIDDGVGGPVTTATQPAGGVPEAGV